MQDTSEITDEERAADELRTALDFLLDPHRSRTFTRHAYRELPPQSEMKIARVASIRDRGNLLPPAARLIGVHGLGRFEKGMYVVVPADFPDTCDTHITSWAVYATAKVGDEYRSFYVRPQATTEEAWRVYEQQREWANAYYEDLGRVYRRPDLKALTRPSEDEIFALALEYSSAAARPGVTGGPGNYVLTPPRALAVYRHPDASSDDPHHLGVMLALALRLCSNQRAYTAIFLPEDAEEKITPLLERALELEPRLCFSDKIGRMAPAGEFTGEYHPTLGVMDEENAGDSDRTGWDNVTLVTRAGRDALLASGRTERANLFTAVVAAAGSFDDPTEARDQLLKHFHGSHLALVWTDAPPPADAPPADYHLAGAVVTYDAQLLGGSA